MWSDWFLALNINSCIKYDSKLSLDYYFYQIELTTLAKISSNEIQNIFGVIRNSWIILNRIEDSADLFG